MNFICDRNRNTQVYFSLTLKGKKCLPFFIFLKEIMTVGAPSSKGRGESPSKSIVWLRTCDKLQVRCGLACSGPVSWGSTEMSVPRGDLLPFLQILPQNLKIRVLRVQPPPEFTSPWPVLGPQSSKTHVSVTLDLAHPCPFSQSVCSPCPILHPLPTSTKNKQHRPFSLHFSFALERTPWLIWKPGWFRA